MLDVSLDDLKQYLSIKTGMPTAEDGKLQAILDMAIAFVSDYTGIQDEPAGVEYTFEDYLPYPNNRVIMDTNSAEAITNVLVNNTATGVTGSVVKGYMAVLSAPVTGLIKIVYTTKDAITQGEKALEVAVMELSKYYYKQEYKVSFQAQGESITYDKVSYIPAHVKSILDMYRRG